MIKIWKMNHIMKTKSNCERIHVKRRLKERFGIEVNRNDLSFIIAMIQNNSKDVTFIGKESNRVSLFDVFFNHQVIRFAYDKIRKELITALIPRALPLHINLQNSHEINFFDKFDYIRYKCKVVK